MQSGDEEYRKLLTAAIQKQIVIFGPAIILSKARNVPGLVLKDDGEVVSITGDGQEISKRLIEEFGTISSIAVDRFKESMTTISNLPEDKPKAAITGSPAEDTLMPIPAPLPTSLSAEPPNQAAGNNLNQGNTENQVIKEQNKV